MFVQNVSVTGSSDHWSLAPDFFLSVLAANVFNVLHESNQQAFFVRPMVKLLVRIFSKYFRFIHMKLSTFRS